MKLCGRKRVAVKICWFKKKFYTLYSGMAGRWFSPGTPVSSNNKTDYHNITEILLKVVLNTINQPSQLSSKYHFIIYKKLTQVQYFFQLLPLRQSVNLSTKEVTDSPLHWYVPWQPTHLPQQFTGRGYRMARWPIWPWVIISNTRDQQWVHHL